MDLNRSNSNKNSKRRFRCSYISELYGTCTANLWWKPETNYMAKSYSIFTSVLSTDSYKIRIRFEKESPHITREEIDYMRAKIATLSNTKIEGKGTIFIKHTMILTMVDAKVCNVATTMMSTMKCYICGATSKDFNLLSNKKN